MPQRGTPLTSASSFCLTLGSMRGLEDLSGLLSWPAASASSSEEPKTSSNS